jgi:hypothetical protein
MRILLIAAAAWLAGSVGGFAQEIVVFGRGNSLVLAPGIADTNAPDMAKASFLAAFKADLQKPAAFGETAELIDFPNHGRSVPGAGGGFRYHPSFPGGLVVVTTLEGLLPNHKYMLTLNGKPERAGNTNLVQTVSNKPGEKYYDFQTVMTDATGGYRATFGVMLPAGEYEVRFFVKDRSDYKIVLYHDFFKFTVE